MKKLDFVLVGFPKCGTTSLHNILSKHPDIALPSSKELPCFDSKIPDLERLNEFISKADLNGRLIGKITPQYIYSPFALENLREYNRQLKIIILLRNPVDRFLSHHQMYVNRGLTEGDIPNEYLSKYFEGYLDSYTKEIFEASRFDYYIDEVFNKFPSKQIYISSLEHFIKDTKDSFLSLYNFLGVKYIDMPFNISNTSRSSVIRKYGDPLYWQRDKYLSIIYPLVRLLFPRKYRKRVAFRLKTAELGQKSILPYLNSDLKFWLKKEATQWKEVD